jgi:hypothetical protein
MGNSGRDLQTVKVATLEPDAVICRRRLQAERDFVAGMKTNSGARDRATKSTLHDLSLGLGEPLRAQQSTCHGKRGG